MRSRILLVISAMLVLGIGIAVYAFNVTGTDAATAACCCCTESCPMKKGDKAAASTAEAATADQKADATHSCCGDSCPMKSKSADGKTADGKAVAGHSCCGDSCPMKGKAAKHDGTGHDMKADGHSCPMMKGGKTDGKTGAVMNHDTNHKMTADGHSCACPCCSKEKAEKKADAAI